MYIYASICIALMVYIILLDNWGLYGMIEI